MRRGTSGRVSGSCTASATSLQLRASSVSTTQATTTYFCGITGATVAAVDIKSHLKSDTFLRNKLIFDRLQGGEWFEGGIENSLNPLLAPVVAGADEKASPISSATGESLRKNMIDLKSSTPATSLNIAFEEDSSHASTQTSSSSSPEEATPAAVVKPTTPAVTQQSKLSSSAASFWKNTGKGVPTSTAASLSLEEQGDTAAQIMAAHKVPPPPLAPTRIWDAVSKNVHLMSEFNLPKHSQRLSRANVALKFLRDHHVILHSALRWSNGNPGSKKDAPGSFSSSSPDHSSASGGITSTSDSSVGEGGNASGGGVGTWNVSSPFYRVAMVGEVQLRTELFTRMTKLFPMEGISGATFAPSSSTPSEESVWEVRSKRIEALNKLISETHSAENLAQLFDNLELNRILEAEGRRQSPLNTKQKASMMCAIAGELHWFVVRTKATDRTKVTALFPPSDVLILHVLAVHVLEVFTASLAYQIVKPAASRILQSAWPYYTSTFVEQVADKTPTVSKLLRVQPEPRAFDAECDTLSNLLYVDKKQQGKDAPQSEDNNGELTRRLNILINAEKAAAQRHGQMNLDALNKGVKKLETKIENLKKAESAPVDGTTLALDAEGKKRRQVQAVSDIKGVMGGREKKLAALRTHIEAYTLVIEKRKSAIETKYQRLRDAIQSSVSPSSSILSGDEVVVKPLLHRTPFMPNSTIKREVSHSEVALNFKALDRYASLGPKEVVGGYLDVSKRMVGRSFGERLGNEVQLSPRSHPKFSPTSSSRQQQPVFMGLKSFIGQMGITVTAAKQ